MTPKSQFVDKYVKHMGVQGLLLLVHHLQLNYVGVFLGRVKGILIPFLPSQCTSQYYYNPPYFTVSGQGAAIISL